MSSIATTRDRRARRTAHARRALVLQRGLANFAESTIETKGHAMNKNELSGSTEPLRSDAGARGGGDDARISIEKLRAAGRNLGEQLQEQLDERPYVVLGAAVGAGFVAGALVGSRIGQIAVAIAAGYVIRNALRTQGADVQKLVKQGIDKLTAERATS
jgi:hypothetical protein